MKISKFFDSQEKFPSVKEVSEEFFADTHHQMDKTQLELLTKTLKFRSDTKEDKAWGGNIFVESGIFGYYLVALNNGENKDDYFIVGISNSPLAILKRTTGREGYSCEQITQPYWKGPFQDISYRNPTVYFFKPNDEWEWPTTKAGLDVVMKDYTEKKWNKTKFLFQIKKDDNLSTKMKLMEKQLLKNKNLVGWDWAARLNTRWCITETGKLDVGIDPNIYPMKGPKPPIYDDYMVAIWNIFATHGFLNYFVAETPYVYVGHSDSTAGGGKFHLPFIGLKYRTGSANEQTAYDLMKHRFGIKSRNEKMQPVVTPETYIEATWDEHDEDHIDIIDKIMIEQRLTHMEMETLKEILIINYEYRETEVENMNDDEVIETFKTIYRL